VGFDAAGQNLMLTGREGLFRCAIIGTGAEAQCSLGKPILVNEACADPVAGRKGWVSANGQICAIVGNYRCQLFRTDTFEKVAETGRQPGMRFCALSPDGSLFASGAFHAAGVGVWDTATGGLVKQLPAAEESSDPGANVAFSPDGRLLVISTVDGFAFWEVGSWTLKRSIPQVPDNPFVGMMAFSPDGRIFAGTHSRNTVRLHETATGKLLADLEAPNPQRITGLTFSQDGAQLFTCQSHDALMAWDLRQIRGQLAELGLDWNHPPFPEAEPSPATLAKPFTNHTSASPVIPAR
jgi:WD40 repeat protein